MPVNQKWTAKSFPFFLLLFPALHVPPQSTVPVLLQEIPDYSVSFARNQCPSVPFAVLFAAVPVPFTYPLILPLE